MIPHESLPRISSILEKLGVPVGRRGRTKCPIHQGENREAFSYNDNNGLWYCFRCGVGGDIIRLVELSIPTDFQGALRFLGIESGEPPLPDPSKAIALMAERRRMEALINQQRELREKFRIRNTLASYATERLMADTNDEVAWEILRIAYCDGPPLDVLEEELNQLLTQIPTEAYRTWKDR